LKILNAYVDKTQGEGPSMNLQVLMWNSIFHRLSAIIPPLL